MIRDSFFAQGSGPISRRHEQILVVAGWSTIPFAQYPSPMAIIRVASGFQLLKCPRNRNHLGSGVNELNGECIGPPALPVFFHVFPFHECFRYFVDAPETMSGRA